MKNKKIKTALFIFFAFFLIAGFKIAPSLAAGINSEVELYAPIPGANQAAESVSGLSDYLVKIYNFGIAIAGILAVIMIVRGGVMYVAAFYAGNVVKTQGGMEYVKSALTGLAIVLLSYLIIYTVDPRLTNPKDVFMNIPEAVCQGGFANTDSLENCKGKCTIGSLTIDPIELKADWDSTTKCCKCDSSSDQDPLSAARNKCTEDCKNDASKCAGGNKDKCWGEFFNGKCVCRETKFESPEQCSGGKANQPSARVCNALCYTKDPSYMGSWDVGTKCCKCVDSNNEYKEIQ